MKTRNGGIAGRRSWLAGLAMVAMTATAVGGWGCGDAAPVGSGGGGAATTASCPDHVSDVRVAMTVVGSNGIFFDHCDANGDLIEYQCVNDDELECNDEECFDSPYPTSEVIAYPVSCGGTCRDGACQSACPAVGTEVQFQSLLLDGSGVVVEPATGKRWSCDFGGSFETPAATAKYLGVTLTVTSTGWASNHICLPGSAGQWDFEGPSFSSSSHWACEAL